MLYLAWPDHKVKPGMVSTVCWLTRLCCSGRQAALLLACCTLRASCSVCDVCWLVDWPGWSQSQDITKQWRCRAGDLQVTAHRKSVGSCAGAGYDAMPDDLMAACRFHQSSRSR
jgi:hypothetical protein